MHQALGFPLEQHAVAIAKKTVFLGYGRLIQRHDVLVTSKSTHQHHQSAFWQVEVGQQNIDDLKVKAWRDENLRIAFGFAKCSPAL